MTGYSSGSKDRYVDLLKRQLLDNKENIILQWKNPAHTNTRHFILDSILPRKDVNEIYNAFPRDGSGFFNRESFREKKRTSADLKSFDSILSDITYALQDESIVRLIADLLGINDLVPDPKLYAGGLSMMFPDDYLNPHIDNSHDGDRSCYRRLNLLFYVSPNWTKENGGNFELWNAERTIPKTITAHQNRLIVMETNKTSWHSVSAVRTDRPRCCVSSYYFSKISPDGSSYFHVTSFLGRPGQPLRQAIGKIDNSIRGIISRILKKGRGSDLINKDQ